MFLRVCLSALLLLAVVQPLAAQNSHMFCLASVQSLKPQDDWRVRAKAKLEEAKVATSTVLTSAVIEFERLAYQGVSSETLKSDLSASSPVRTTNSTAGQLFRLWGRFRLDQSGALFLPVFTSAQLRLCYSDIFETRAHPEKGGHGLSVLLRYSFRPKQR